jgi:hypothetical protein
VVRFGVPVGIVIGVVAMAVFGTLRSSEVGADRAAAQSGTTMVLIALGLVALTLLVRPLNALRIEMPSAKELMPIVVDRIGGGALLVLAVTHQDRIAAAAAAVDHRRRH